MGCALSRIDNEESVTRCKDRRNHMKDAVSARNAFAAAHTAYSVSLKNTGAALSDFSLSESYPPTSSSSAVPPPPPPPPPPLPPHIDTLPPPPPPLPSFSPSPLKRSSTLPSDMTSSPTFSDDRSRLNELNRRGFDKSPLAIEEEEEEQEEQEVKLHLPPRPRKSGVRERMSDDVVAVATGAVKPPPPPPIPESKGMAWDYFFMVENMPGSGLGGGSDAENEDDVASEEGDDEEEEVVMNGGHIHTDGNMAMRMGYVRNDGEKLEFKTPEKEKKSAVEVEEKDKEEVEIVNANAVISGVVGANMGKVMSEIDDHFLKASESAQEVSRMLEATRLHFHSNFADDRGFLLLDLGSFKI